MVRVGRRVNKSFRKIGAKDVSRGLKTGAKVATLGASAAALAGQPELAVPDRLRAVAVCKAGLASAGDDRHLTVGVEAANLIFILGCILAIKGTAQVSRRVWPDDDWDAITIDCPLQKCTITINSMHFHLSQRYESLPKRYASYYLHNKKLSSLQRSSIFLIS